MLYHWPTPPLPAKPRKTRGPTALFASAGRWVRRGLLAALCGLALTLGWPLSAETLAKADRGELGSDLRWLAQFYTPPQPEESNHYLDVWAGSRLREIAALNGLTNNRALIVNSHGIGVPAGWGNRYAFYPHSGMLATGQVTPYYSARDLARVIGSTRAREIHNLIIGGCNANGAFSSAELRKYFVNATNITHMAAGELGYQPMLIQALVNASALNRPVYEAARTNQAGKVEYHMGSAPALNATRMQPYIAELFRPGETKPFRTQTAGRELLEPAASNLISSARN